MRTLAEVDGSSTQRATYQRKCMVLIALNAMRAVPESTALFRNVKDAAKSASESWNDKVTGCCSRGRGRGRDHDAETDCQSLDKLRA